MKQYIILLFIVLFLNPLNGQKKIDLPENKLVHSFVERLPKNLRTLSLKDLRSSSDSINIRIWQTHTVFTLSYNETVSSEYKIHTSNDNPIVSNTSLPKNIAQSLLDSLLECGLMDLHDDKYGGIDGSYVFFELATRDTYKVLSFWSPHAERSADCKVVVSILDIVSRTVDSKKLHAEFFNALPSGGYRWGMTSIHIDQFLDKDAVVSDFYLQVEKKVKAELNITEKTNHWEFPLIYINNKPAMIADINNIINQEVSSIEVIKPDDELIVLYGTRGSNGVVKIETR
ncbi:hypothetical protein [Carboxylicivirga sp. N1Y90]|uniref:hypothetical protein n=1 Tax=Carboxylicivirga fragile TaxID=3417571 RepID=UPI003D345BE1|nr:hypothetical protein [Marinilabiliaceae bacterium N1Y90]